MDYRDRWELKDYLIGKTLERRIRLFQIALILLLLGFLLNFWYLQGVHGEEYAHLAENNRLRRLPSLPTRGTIFDRGETALAATRPSLDLILLREDAADLEAQLEHLVPILQTSYEELQERVARGKDQPAYEPLVLREDVELEELARIEARRELFPSLQVRETARRSYVHGDLFAHVIGYVGEVGDAELARLGELRPGDIVGKTGLERWYDPGLRGLRGWDLVAVNNLGRRIGAAWVGREPSHGEPLELTLDLRLQRVLREALADEAGAGIFMDPRTGEVLALVSTPAFDPNSFADGLTADAWKSITEDPRRPLHDRAIASYYAPGSVFKVVMAVAGLESGAVDPGDVVHCRGSARLYNRDRLCWKRGGHGNVDLRRALAHSCNVYFYLLGKQMGIGPINAYGARFGLGQPTGIDLPGEVNGILPSRAWKREHLGEPWYPGDTISVAIGQGLLAVTPAQMVTMISAVATGGAVVTPHLVRGDAGKSRRLDVKPTTLAFVRGALSEAVRSGTGRAASLEKVSVAGKTGTAQVFRHSAGVDSDDLPKQERDHGWFVGYAPAEQPRIAFAVVVEHGGHGGTSAAPVVRKVLEVFFAEEAEPPGAAGRRASRSPRDRRDEEHRGVHPPPAG
jgi:penicillin-binding protein 2